MTGSDQNRLPDRLVGVSLKMYFDVPQTLAYLSAIASASFAPSPTSNSNVSASEKKTTALFVVPSFPLLAHAETQSLLRHVSSEASRPPILLGVQNAHYEDRGAFTGETSPVMLKQLGVSIVELGHAERRAEPYNESNTLIAKKVKAVLRNGMIPLVCIGEKTQGAGLEIAVHECEDQIDPAIEAALEEGVDKTAGIVFAYEPVWAIGASKPASADHVLAVIQRLRDGILNRYSTLARPVRFLYGGSAGPGTWSALKSGCDGLFLGRFAHDVENLVRVWEEVVTS